MKALTDMTLDELQNERVKVFQQRLEAIYDGKKDHWCQLVDYSEAIAIEIDQRLIKKADVSKDMPASKVMELAKKEVLKRLQEIKPNPENY